MGWRNAFVLIGSIAFVIFGGATLAQAQCAALPYTLSNGNSADATQVMANFNTLRNCITSQTSLQVAGPGGGTISLLNPGATATYNFNLPATAGTKGALLTSGGGASAAETWTSVGASGHALPFLDGANVWSGTQTFGSVLGTVSTQSGATYTLAAGDCGTTILFTASSAVTVTTTSSLPKGCSIAIEQGGGGQIAIAAGTGATQHSAHGFTKTFGQYAILGVFVDTNAGGSAADVIITGDGA
jgi:hypothetical protein